MWRRVLKWFFALFVTGTAVLVAGFVWLTWGAPDEVVLPDPTGPHAVSRVPFEWTDAARIDPLAPEPGVAREIIGWIWYPAAPSSAPATEYIPAALVEALRAEAHPLVRAVMSPFMADQANVRSHATQGGPLPAEPQAFPVVLLKPAYGGLVEQYAVLAEDLASQGYIVVGVNAPYTAFAVAFEDGRIARRTPAGHPSETAPGPPSELAPGQPNDLAVPVAKVLAEDLRFVLDRLQQINGGGAQEQGVFAGRLDLGSIGAFGHSFGGAVSLQFCKDDARCKAAINIDGGIWGDVALGGLSKPALFFMSDRPILRASPAALKPDQKAMMDALARIRGGLPNRVNMMVLEGAEHYNFGDSALQIGPNAGRMTGALGEIDPLRAIQITRRYVRAFFDTYLRSGADPLVAGPSPDYPEVVVQ